MLSTLLKKLITTATGRVKFIMAMVGLSIALLLILIAVQLQVNYNTLLHSKTNQDSIANFLVVNKILNNQTYKNTTVSDTEIAAMRSQPFIDAVGVLTPSRYKAAIQSNSERFPFYTDIAFESVPSNFIDVQSADWKWDASSELIPMIAPNMFLDFYNFEFSFSQNLPQLTQDIVKLIVFKVIIQTPSGPVSFNGRVVGFSDRITSLLVPQSFMDYANTHFSSKQSMQPSRIILQTKDPGNPALVQYLQQKGFTTDADKTRFSKYRKIVEAVVAVSWVTGAILLTFALLIFSMFIQLTIASCKDEIKLLITLGASPKQLYKFLMLRFLPPNIWIILLAILVTALLQYGLSKLLEPQFILVDAWLSVYTLLVALALGLLFWLTNHFTIRKYIQVQKS